MRRDRDEIGMSREFWETRQPTGRRAPLTLRQRSQTSLSEAGRDLRGARAWRSSESLDVIRRTSPRTVQVAGTLIQQYAQRRIENHHAGTLFGVEQVRLVVQQYLRVLDGENVCTLEDMRDLKMNLVAVYFDLTRRHNGVAQSLAHAISTLFCITDDIEMALAALTYREPTVETWTDVGALLIERARDDQPAVFGRYIPRITDFEFLKVLGAEEDSVLYLAKYVPARFVCSVKLTKRTAFTEQFPWTDKVPAFMERYDTIVRTLCQFVASHHFVYVMEYVPSIPVQFLIQPDMGIRDQTLIQIIAIQAVDAIRFLHKKGIIHGDIKPGCMWLSTYAELRVTDADLCTICISHQLTRQYDCYYKLTAEEVRSRPARGTPWFTAPEILSGRPYGRASDWWSLGVSLFVITFGYAPFNGPTRRGIEESVMYDGLQIPHQNAPPRYYRYSPDLAVFLTELLRKRPQDRLGSRNYEAIMFHQYVRENVVQMTIDYDRRNLVTAYNRFTSNVIRPEDDPAGITLPERRPLERIQGWLSNVLGRGGPPEPPQPPPRTPLADAPREQQLPIFTFASWSWRRLLEQVRQGYVDERLEYDPTPPVRGADQAGPDTDPCRPSFARLSRLGVLTTNICVRADDRDVNARWDSGFQYRTVKDSRNGIVLLVTNIAEGSPAARCGLFEGDMILRWNQQFVNGHEVTSACSGPEILLEVHALNSFRLLRTCDNIVPAMKTLKPPIRLRVPSGGAEGDSFGADLVFSWSQERGDYEGAHLVYYVDTSVVPQGELYEGDLVLSQRPDASGLFTELSIVPTSVLRMIRETFEALNDLLREDRRRKLVAALA